jgi:hypothetical protein
MNRPDTQSFDEDATMPIVEMLNDGSLAGLATYHLVKRQLLEIRGLPGVPPHRRPVRGV